MTHKCPSGHLTFTTTVRLLGDPSAPLLKSKSLIIQMFTDSSVRLKDREKFTDLTDYGDRLVYPFSTMRALRSRAPGRALALCRRPLVQQIVHYFEHSDFLLRLRSRDGPRTVASITTVK
jgi:hypothetical protein